ncbi:hypothetical protein SBADM41S_09924 [Streptomyces badius]
MGNAEDARIPEGAEVPEGAVSPEEQWLGPVLRRREQVQPGTTDQRLLDSEATPEWVHTDPGGLRIQSEFVEELPRERPTAERDRSRLGPHPRRITGVRGRGGDRQGPGRRGLRDHRRRPGRDGSGQQGRPGGQGRLRWPRHRAALRVGPQPARRHRRHSATSSSARRCREVRPGLRGPAGGLGTLANSSRPSWSRPARSPASRSSCSARRTGAAWSTGSATRWWPRARPRRRTCCCST